MAGPVVLHVDDDPGDLQLLREAFAENHIAAEIVSVASGEAALDYLRRESASLGRPRLVLLDLNLRTMSGREVLQAIKREPALSGITTVILTTSDHSADRDACLKMGADSYCVKPSSFSALLELVQALTARHLAAG
jgi:DNA-binding response OmpR family regulator